MSRLETRAAAVMQVLPRLLDVCPEARLNLAVHHLRQGQLQEAFKLVKDLQPATPQEYTLKGQQRMLLICMTHEAKSEHDVAMPVECSPYARCLMICCVSADACSQSGHSVSRCS